MEKTNTELIYENNSKFVIQAAFTGVIAGSFAQFLASPIDLIKVNHKICSFFDEHFIDHMVCLMLYLVCFLQIKKILDFMV